MRDPRIRDEDVENVADRLIDLEKRHRTIMRPPIETAVFRWRGEEHYGGIQIFWPEKPHIAYVTKTSGAVDSRVIAAILRKGQFLIVECPQDIDFMDRIHVLGYDKSRRMLHVLSREDTLFAGILLQHIHITEIVLPT